MDAAGVGSSWRAKSPVGVCWRRPCGRRHCGGAAGAGMLRIVFYSKRVGDELWSHDNNLAMVGLGATARRRPPRQENHRLAQMQRLAEWAQSPAHEQQHNNSSLSHRWRQRSNGLLKTLAAREPSLILPRRCHVRARRHPGGGGGSASGGR